MSTPNQPGSDRQNPGSANQAPPEQQASRTPQNGSARPNPQQGSAPQGPQASAGRGPAQAGPAARPGGAPDGRPDRQAPADPARSPSTPQHQGPRTQTPQGRPVPPSQQGHAPNQQAPGHQGPPQQASGNRAPAGGAPTESIRGNQAPPWQRGMQREPQTNLKRPVQGGAGAKQSRPEGQPNPANGSATAAAAGAAAAKAPAGQDVQKPQTAPTQKTQQPQAQGQRPQGAQNGGAPTQAVPTQKAPAQNPSAPAKGQPAPKEGPDRTPSSTATAATAAVGAVSGAAAGAVTQREAAKAKASAIDGPTRHINRDVLPKDMPDLSEAKHPLPGAAAAGQQPKVAVAPQRVEEGEALRATVQVRKIDPWSTLKISSVISVSLFFVWMVAVGLLYVVLDGMGVWDRLNNAFTDIVAESSSDGLVTAGQVFGYAAVIGLANMVLFTALATIGAFIYNLCSDLVGGVEVTLADRD
ncbi:DUF3566 domain-containing protein [Rhodococcus sp. IEGM 1351]|nr:DUF3566 domain-containing protein [Rhodococcus sp. IEGM 1351]MDI9937511.1 DUF3566 domain-containing protein [Rhodococcus sp. IEGM 1351]